MDDLGQAALEAASGLCRGLSLRSLSFEIGTAIRVPSGSDRRRSEQRTIQLTVPTAVEAVTGRVTDRGWERRSAGECSEYCGGRKPLDSSRLTEDLRRDDRSDTFDGQNLGRLACGSLDFDVPLELVRPRSIWCNRVIAARVRRARTGSAS